jgi:hypothetical protein
MATRYTTKDIAGALRGLNITAGFTAAEADSPLWYTDTDGERRAMVGRYYVQGAYGGWKLVQVVNEGGGERSITAGYSPRRELYALIHAYREGMHAASAEDRYTVAAIRARVPEYRAERAGYAAAVASAREGVQS